MCFSAGTCCLWKCSLFPNNSILTATASTLPLWSQKYYVYETANSVIINWKFTQLSYPFRTSGKSAMFIWCFAGFRVSVLYTSCKYHLHDLSFYKYQLRRSSSVLSKNIRMIHYRLSCKFLIETCFLISSVIHRIWRLIPRMSTSRCCERSSGASPAPTGTSRRLPGRPLRV